MEPTNNKTKPYYQSTMRLQILNFVQAGSAKPLLKKCMNLSWDNLQKKPVKDHLQDLSGNVADKAGECLPTT